MLTILNALSQGALEVLNFTSVDLNTLTTQGEFTGTNCTATNGPTGDANTEFKLLVRNSGGVLSQTLFTVLGRYVRTYSGGVWSTWARYYTVATLPAAASNAYMRTFVTDASAPSFGSAVAGGGAVVTPVFSNGTAWIVG